MIERFSNNAASTLASNITATATSILLKTGTGALFPTLSGSDFFRLVLTNATSGNTEIAFCTNRTGDTLTVTRNQETTPATTGLSTGTGLAFSIGDGASHEITAGMMANVYSPSSDQQNAVRYALDTGTANAKAIALTPAMTTSIAGTTVIFKALNTNTGATTITINGGTTYQLLGNKGVALTGGEIQANAIVTAIFNGTAYVLTTSTITTTNLVENGYKKFLDGTIIQWGNTALLTGNGDVVSFSIAFPNAILHVNTSDSGSGCHATGWAKNGTSLSNFLGYGKDISNNSYISTSLSWLAIGY